MKRVLASLSLLLWGQIACADNRTLVSSGINSDITGLDGSGVKIGQFELDRTPDPNFDTNENLYHTQVHPSAIYYGGVTETVVNRTDAHPLGVASILIGTDDPDFRVAGVAPAALLHSAGYSPIPSHHDELGLALSRLADINNVNTINISHLLEVQFPESVDGNNFFSQFVDWSARTDDVLYTIAFTYDTIAEDPAPTDSYNSIVVGASNRLPDDDDPFGDGPWRQSWSEHYYQWYEPGGRTFIDILAPGVDVQFAQPGDAIVQGSGTSVAAPHVAAAGVLLEQFARQQVGWNLDNALSHQVRKAILMNSADKLKGVHGATRTVVDSSENDWTQSPAYGNRFVPLDPEMGVGHLNVEAAINNYKSGQHGFGSVPNRGWDFFTIGDIGDTPTYTLQDELQVGDWVSVTLAWDRIVESTNGDPDDWDYGDTFFDRSVGQSFSNLDLYLAIDGVPMPTSNFRAASTEFDSTVEHIFFEVDVAGVYEIIIAHGAVGLGVAVDYGLAWWAGEFADAHADFDNDGDVDGQDLNEWESDFGTNGVDANGDGFTDGRDFLIWQREHGLGVSVLTAVPEPSAWALSAFAALALGGVRGAWHTRLFA